MINKILQKLYFANNAGNKELIDIENKKNILNEQIEILNKDIKRIQWHTITNYEVIKKEADFTRVGGIDDIIMIDENTLIFRQANTLERYILNSNNEVLPIAYEGTAVKIIENLIFDENNNIHALINTKGEQQELILNDKLVTKTYETEPVK